MKTFLRFLTIMVALCWATTAHAQGVWRYIPIPNLNLGDEVTAITPITDSIVVVAIETQNQRARIMRTADGGNTWTEQTSQATPLLIAPIRAMIAVGDTLVINSDTQLYFSYDQGLTWQADGRNTQGGYLAFSYNGQTHVGYATGFQNNVLKTTDGWYGLAADFPTHSPFATPRSSTYALEVIGGGDTLLIATSQNNTTLVPQLGVTHNGGNSWEQTTGLPLGGAFGGISCSGSTCYAGGGSRNGPILTNYFYKSTDAGLTWVDIFPQLGVLVEPTIGTIKSFDPNNCVVFIQQADTVGNRPQNVIYRTTDGGQNWVKDSVTWTNREPFGQGGVGWIHFRSLDLIYAAFPYGYLLKYEVQPSSVQIPQAPVPSASVKPNPVGTSLTVQLSGVTSGQFTLTNTLGQVVMSEKLLAPSTTLQRGSLPSGLYTYQVRDLSNNVLGNGQLLFL